MESEADSAVRDESCTSDTLKVLPSSATRAGTSLRTWTCEENRSVKFPGFLRAGGSIIVSPQTKPRFPCSGRSCLLLCQSQPGLLGSSGHSVSSPRAAKTCQKGKKPSSTHHIWEEKRVGCFQSRKICNVAVNPLLHGGLRRTGLCCRVSQDRGTFHVRSHSTRSEGSEGRR